MEYNLLKKSLFGLTALWLILLIICAFVLNVSQTSLLMIYITGQGFLMALLIPYLQQRKERRKRCDL
ncbi:hypothetical protein [Nonlabens marinus]|uniref:Uncharacterized protein n=1 Tax=Nonlabens marinus S1-08 TaxID=1454201 RepID=W8W043_9FLAO|nr:hypothetical protein [Nonlabens marinus]BAO55676.1 hypothetical protein NMS_1667 [Nonlabens marinus S1-08]